MPKSFLPLMGAKATTNLLPGLTDIEPHHPESREFWPISPPPPPLPPPSNPPTEKEGRSEVAGSHPSSQTSLLCTEYGLSGNNMNRNFSPEMSGYNHKIHVERERWGFKVSKSLIVLSPHGKCVGEGPRTGVGIMFRPSDLIGGGSLSAREVL